MTLKIKDQLDMVEQAYNPNYSKDWKYKIINLRSSEQLSEILSQKHGKF